MLSHQKYQSDGPWSFSEQNGSPGDCMVAQVWDVFGDSIAIIDATKNEKVANANARIMAASPEMLESLMDAVRLIERLGGNAGNQRKAIFLATGHEDF